MKNWKSIELQEGPEADSLRQELRDSGIYYEASEAGWGYIHFEIGLTEDEAERLQEYIDGMVQEESVCCMSGSGFTGE